jgi:catechol 2,3-dioxygenase-like lactoylglutathione lyase family enzyme
MVGLNHIALEVGDIEEALGFYGYIFEIHLRGKTDDAAFIDLGGQFTALMKGPVRAVAGHRHFGLVVDDRSAVRTLAEKAGARMLDGNFLDFLDPWGNRIEVVEYANIQFTKAAAILRGMRLDLPSSVPSHE